MDKDPNRLAKTGTGQERMLAFLREDAEQQMMDLAKRVPQAMGSGLRAVGEGVQKGILPGKYAVTQKFGNYNPGLYAGINKSMRNTGVDFGVPTGVPTALPSGRWQILQAAGNGWNDGYGGSVLAQNEETGEKLRFSHLSALNAIPGQRLLGGSIIGRVGATGNATGSHLDLEYYDPKGKVADILSSAYANELFGI